jgi:D-glycero-alpha-D-manno-heptose-7-phosphate kinase
MILVRAPLRMSFVGGGSDLPAYYKENVGAVVSTAINKFVYVTVNKKFDDNIRLSYSQTENVNSSSKIVHPIVRNALEIMRIEKGIEITSISDIPSHGTGLGSSSSFSVALLHALHSFQNKIIAKQDLGELACMLEMEKCLAPIGKQDQFAAAFGGLNFMQFYPNGDVSVEPITCTESTKTHLNESIICFYTGRSRSASDILQDQSENLNRSEVVRLMKKMVTLSYDLRDSLNKDDCSSFGELLDLNWQLKRRMSSSISDNEIDQWYDEAIKAGAYGGKLMGAGNGGFLMFYAPKEKHENIERSLSNLRKVNISFESEGSVILYSNQ